MGILKWLQDTGQLEDLKEISCSSTGSILAFFYILTGGDFEKIFDIQSKVNLDEIGKIEIKNLIHKYGLINSERFEDIIAKKSITNPTFKELYDLNPIKLYITTYDIVTKKTYYMSVDTAPNMKVSHAIRRSISVPLLFTPHFEDGKIFVDGSTTIYNPYEPFLGKNDEVLEIRVGSTPSTYKKPKTLFKYLKLLVSMYCTTRYDYKEFKRLEICSDIDMFNFGMSEEEKYKLYLEGYTVGINSQ